MLALGIHWAHDASVAVCSPSGCVFALAEERVTRIKHHYGFPMEAIRTAFRELAITGKDIDIVAVSTRKPLFPFQGNYVSARTGRKAVRARVREFAGWRPGAPKIAAPSPPPAKTGAALAGTGWEGFEPRHWSHFHEAMNELGLLSPGIRYVYVAHHRAHAASTFRLAGMREEKICVVTLDGKGDGYSGTIYLGHEDGRLDLIRATPAQHSLGSFYQAIRRCSGSFRWTANTRRWVWRRWGAPGLPNPFDGLVEVRDGVTRSRLSWTFRSYNAVYPSKQVPNPLGSVAETEIFREYLERSQPSRWRLRPGAPGEDHGRVDSRYVDAHRRPLSRRGRRRHVECRSQWPGARRARASRHFVFPDSADSGLSVGAAIEGLYVCGAATTASLPSPYLGHRYTDEQVAAALAGSADFDVEDAGDRLPARVARELARGRVIGTFQGRLEAGPRALGNRSVLADPRDPAIKERINDILKGREWFVPFAPVVLEDEATKYWDGSIDYRHMTFTVAASDFAKKHVPGVVHVDRTMRPQVVNVSTHPWLHAVLQAFRALTDEGVLINTLFTATACRSWRAGRALVICRQGWVDGLAIGRCFITRMP